jgi:hypothetical protein
MQKQKKEKQMNLKQIIKLNAFNAIVAVLNSFNSVWSANTVVSAAITNLTAYINTLLLADGVRLTGTKGVTNNKNLARNALITFALSHAAAGRAYAVNNNLPLLKQICTVNKTTFKNTKEAELGVLCGNIYSAILPYIAGLTPYGATAASAATFNTSINNYHSLMGTPQAQISATVSASLTVEQQITNIDNLLKETIDPLMVQYGSNVNLSQQYVTARKLHTVGVHHWLTVMGLVTDVHGNPLLKAKVRVVEIKTRKKITKADGKYKFLRLHLNTTYTIEVSMSGYLTQTFTISEATAQTVHHTFAMVAAGGTTPAIPTTTTPATA